MRDPLSIAEFERSVFGRDCEAALRQLLRIAVQAESDQVSLIRLAIVDPDLYRRLTHRLATAIQALLLDPKLELNYGGFTRLVAQHRNLATIFGASGFEGTRHLPELFGLAVDGETVTLPSTRALCKMLCCCGLDALPEPFVRALPQVDPAIALPAVLALLSQRAVLTPRAERNRRWLLTHADFLDHATLPDHPLWMARLASAWMLCSYSEEPQRHRVKQTLNGVVRRWLESHGLHDAELPTPRRLRDRPSVLVIGEQFDAKHVMFRTYAPFIRQLASRFRCLLLVEQGRSDTVSEALFDEVIVLDRQRRELPAIIDEVKRLAPDLSYFPSVGMSNWAVPLANLRLAPIQFMSLGHPASSFSRSMDYLIMGHLMVGDPARYSERVLALESPGGQREMRHDAVPVAAQIRARPALLRVAIPSRLMKLTAGFLRLCQELVGRSPRRVELHFFPNETGLLDTMTRAAIRRQLPGAIVHHRTGYNDYIATLNRCDLALSSFPFTNSNSAVDCYRQAIPMVIYGGVEAQERSDLRTAQAVKAPAWLVATSREQYLENALRLVGDDALRVVISRQLLASDIDQLLFDRDRAEHPTAFVDTVEWIYRHHEAVQRTDRRLWTAEDRRAFVGG